jgi:microcystin-dependent protein
MSDQYLGEIRLFGGNYAPQGWEFCAGQLLSITAYQTLFSVIGARYGGDGVNNFKLPDLRGRVAMGQGQGAGLTPRTAGQALGTETVTLKLSEIGHGHALMASADTKVIADPLVKVLGTLPDKVSSLYRGDTEYDTALDDSTVGKIGNGRAHANMMPSLGIHYIIAVSGNFPTRD